MMSCFIFLCPSRAFSFDLSILFARVEPSDGKASFCFSQGNWCPVNANCKLKAVDVSRLEDFVDARLYT